MTNDELNLELLKLCYRHDKSEDEITARACKLSKFVLSSGPLVDSTATQQPEKKPRAGTAKASA